MLTICGSTQCRRDGLHGAVMLKDVTLRLQDVQNPAVSIVGGSLASGDWKRGVQTVEVSGSDNTGIREQRVSIDGALRDTKIHGCDDHRLVPCPRGSRRTLAVDTTKSSDGAHTLEVQAIDAAGNASSTRRNVLLDNSPPNPPESLTAAVTGWQAKNGFAATWSNPRVVVGSPIAGVAYELCPEAAPSNDCEATQEVSKGGIASLDDIKLPSPGSWRLALWLIDARMSGSSWNFVGDPRG